MTKPINIRDVPDNYEELLQYVPQNRYTRNAITKNRIITKLASEQSLIGPFQPNLETVFRINQSTQTLLNLSECYFTIDGIFSTTYNPHNSFYYSYKCGALWILKSISRIDLEIGGCKVHSITNPAVLAKLYESLAIDYNDKEHGDLINDGFYPGVDKCNYFGDLRGSTTNTQVVLNNGKTRINYRLAPGVTPNAAGFSYTQLPGLPKNTIYYLGRSKSQTGEEIDTTDKPSAEYPYLIYKFRINLQLKDVFPIESLKPIFNQSVIVRLVEESIGYCGILSSGGTYPIIQSFNQFYLNVYQYNINTEMVNKLEQIYSKPVVEIIDAVDKQIYTLSSIGENSDVQLFVPFYNQFEPSYISIFMPHSLSNNADNGLVIGSGNNKLMWYGTAKNFTQHTPMDYRFMNINKIKIECDGQILYERSFDSNQLTTTKFMDLYDSPLQPLVTNINRHLTNQQYDQLDAVPLNDYSNLYELYKQCRCYHNCTESSCLPFDEWLYSAFSITIPTSMFSRMTVGSQIVISINFGQGMTNAPTSSADLADGKIAINERLNTVNTTDNTFTTTVLKDVVIVQRYKKALVYQGPNNCSVKTITQSFDQDIIVEEPNESHVNAN